MFSKKDGRQFLKGLSSYRVASGSNSEVAASFLESLDCPRALTALILFRNGEHEQLANLGFDPNHYDSMVATRDAYAATKFLSKFKGLTLDYDLDEVAFKKFDEFELLCKATNTRFRRLSRDPLYKGRVVRLHTEVVRKINRILGEFDTQEFFAAPDWGPGASTVIKRRDASPATKFQFETGITRDLHSLIPLEVLQGAYPLWGNHLRQIGYPRFEVGNKVVTVAKDATTNRVIAIEPGINMFFQKSLGDMIGRRLRRYGVDLRWQSTNQELARQGSILGHLATIDLSSASDSVAKGVVEELFSLEHSKRWYQVMEASRSHFGTRNGNSMQLWEKFSSMGNGFTFQLESLIFYAISSCCAEHLHLTNSQVSVYGDDIIIPTTCYELFSELMVFYGFRINAKKSHYNSPFRESCGAHYYSGVGIKPVYFKDTLSSVLSVYRLANAVRRLAHRRNGYYGCDQAFQATFDLLVQKVPKALRLKIPETLGDGGFISNFDEATPRRTRKGLDLRARQLEGWIVKSATEVCKTYQEDRVGYLLATLWQMPSYDHLIDENGREVRAKLEAIEQWLHIAEVEGRNSVPLRNMKKLRCSNSLVQQWYDLGPWL